MSSAARNLASLMRLYRVASPESRGYWRTTCGEGADLELKFSLRDGVSIWSAGLIRGGRTEDVASGGAEDDVAAAVTGRYGEGAATRLREQIESTLLAQAACIAISLSAIEAHFGKDAVLRATRSLEEFGANLSSIVSDLSGDSPEAARTAREAAGGGDRRVRGTLRLVFGGRPPDADR